MHSAKKLRSRIQKKLLVALDRKDVSTFIRFWSAVPEAGREIHPQCAFIYAALLELGDQRMTGAQRFGSDQREARLDSNRSIMEMLR